MAINAEEYISLSKRLSEIADREATLQNDVSKARADVLPLQLTIERLTSEKDLAQKSKSWLEG